jgi:hypothetical protein
MPSSVPNRVLMLWLYGMMAFLPIKIFHFPSNLELVDLWVMPALPLLWASFILTRHAISNAYGLAFFLILVGSFVSAFFAPNPLRGTIPIAKEIYLFLWFITLSTLLATLDPRLLRRVIAVWAIAACLHGLLIIAQFLSPRLWHLTTDFAGQSTAYATYRPSGLFISAKAGDANKAAVFQLLGFAPLILSRPPKKVALALAILLLCSILATGSMGTTMAFTVGLTTSVMALLIFDRSSAFIRRYLTQMAVAAVLLLGVGGVVISQNQNYRDHLSTIITGRAAKSSGGRFDLWSRGVNVLDEHGVLLWGVGPENFRLVDPSGNDNQLHNDFLAFAVERGLIGVSGLILFALIAVFRAVRLLMTYSWWSRSTDLTVVVFLASITAMLFVSLTHQIFHSRTLWVLLALQEGMLLQATYATRGMSEGPGLPQHTSRVLSPTTHKVA